MSFGNSQWSKYIFIWQAYYYPADGSLVGEHGIWSVPANYSGSYRIWYKNGVLGAVMAVKNGEVDYSTMKMYDEYGDEMLTVRNK